MTWKNVDEDAVAAVHREMQCSHCGGVMRGSAGLTTCGVHYPLCHPDDGMDCYKLVTVHRHPLTQCPCVDGHLSEEMLRTTGAFQTLDAAIEAVRHSQSE